MQINVIYANKWLAMFWSDELLNEFENNLTPAVTGLKFVDII